MSLRFLGVRDSGSDVAPTVDIVVPNSENNNIATDSVADEAPATNQETTVVKSEANNEPTVTKADQTEPATTEQPVVTDEPKTSEQPAATTEQPITTEEPLTSTTAAPSQTTNQQSTISVPTTQLYTTQSIEAVIPTHVFTDPEAPCFLMSGHATKYITPDWYTALPISVQDSYSANAVSATDLCSTTPRPIPQVNKGLPPSLIGAAVGGAAGGTLLLSVIVLLIKHRRKGRGDKHNGGEGVGLMPVGETRDSHNHAFKPDNSGIGATIESPSNPVRGSYVPPYGEVAYRSAGLDAHQPAYDTYSDHPTYRGY